MNRLVKGCGKTFHLKSLIKKRIIKLTNVKLANNFTGSFRKQRAQVKNKTQEMSSIIGYCQEMGLWHDRHLAPKRIKLRIGMLSYQRIVLWHFGQKEGGYKTCLPFFHRLMQTFKKLPTQAPKRVERCGVIRAWIKPPQKLL